MAEYAYTNLSEYQANLAKLRQNIVAYQQQNAPVFDFGGSATFANAYTPGGKFYGDQTSGVSISGERANYLNDKYGKSLADALYEYSRNYTPDFGKIAAEWQSGSSGGMTSAGSNMAPMHFDGSKWVITDPEAAIGIFEKAGVLADENARPYLDAMFQSYDASVQGAYTSAADKAAKDAKRAAIAKAAVLGVAGAALAPVVIGAVGAGGGAAAGAGADLGLSAADLSMGFAANPAGTGAAGLSTAAGSGTAATGAGMISGYSPAQIAGTTYIDPSVANFGSVSNFGQTGPSLGFEPTPGMGDMPIMETGGHATYTGPGGSPMSSFDMVSNGQMVNLGNSGQAIAAEGVWQPPSAFDTAKEYAEYAKKALDLYSMFGQGPEQAPYAPEVSDTGGLAEYNDAIFRTAKNLRGPGMGSFSTFNIGAPGLYIP